MWPPVRDLTVIELKHFRDDRGLLVPVELSQVVPFPVKRLFWISDVPVGGVRGAHAHKHCQQFMICVTGKLSVETFDGTSERSLQLTAGQALHIPPGIFAAELFAESGSTLLVLCDRPYEPDDYLMQRDALVQFRRQVSSS